METRIGISGWRYPPWRGVFYPPDLPQHKELSFASRRFNSIEINGSFYSLQDPQSYRSWFDATPDDFKFSLKGPRFISHIKRLKNTQAPLANFFGSGVLHLEKKLGPILWQLPPLFLFREELLAEFFQSLPRTMAEAAKLTSKADRITPDVPKLAWKSREPLRYALEVRHPSFENPDFIELLKRHQIALVLADTAGKWPYMEDLTSDFVYLRLHGDKVLYTSGYDDLTLKWWAKRLRLWRRGRQPADRLVMSDQSLPSPHGRDLFVYFDNDVKVHAPRDAARLAHMLS